MHDFSTMPIEKFTRPGGYDDCSCGRHHETSLAYLKIGAGAIGSLPEALAASGITRPFVLCDQNTWRIAQEKVLPVLRAVDIPYTAHVLSGDHIEPDEATVGSICMAYDPASDGVLAVGSGVINDCGKVLSYAVGRPMAVVATAPSMDGYASNSSSMIISRVKVTRYNHCPQAIIADTDILRHAPERMLQAGLGDMLAKYISVCEWRIAHLVTGEPYCENIAGLVRRCVGKIVESADRLMQRDADAVEAVMEGLVLSGIAMSYAQNSRPASGLEHYFSHVWEMMSLERGTPYELHGIQVGVGTQLTLRTLTQLRGLMPDRDKALAYVAQFDSTLWEKEVRRVFGQAADVLLAIEVEAEKNAPQTHAARLANILGHWDAIQSILKEELPALASLEALMRKTGVPVLPEEIGVTSQDVQDAYVHSRDIRNKYITSSLVWDLGLIETVRP